jgi:hypothetical protein
MEDVMNRRVTSLFALVLATLPAEGALANNSELKVCVDVTLHAAATTPKGSDSAAPNQAPAALPSVPQAPQTASPTVPPAPPQAVPGRLDLADQPIDSAPQAKPTTGLAPGQVLVGQQRMRVVPLSEVSADDAASMASEVDPQGSSDPRVVSGAHLPLGQTPTLYLKRLIEHFVTHEQGFIAAQAGCAQRVEVELYPLKVGWTAFARYSGTGREERVDQLLPTELSQFAERSVLALLHDVPIGATVDRDNVLWADSLKSTQRIRGRNHLMLGVGTRLRSGMFDTVSDKSTAQNEIIDQQQLRLFTPMALTLGYRGQFDQYGFEALTELDIGTGVTGVKRNPSGGNIDYGGSAGVALHVLRYLDPRGLASPYFGAGATFALHWFRATRAEENRFVDSRSTLYGGGLDVDLVGGYEFMRASAISFFLQGELTLPAYMVRTENNDGRVNTWFPGAALRLGANFF